MEEMFNEFNFNDAPSRIVDEVCGLKLPLDYIEFMKKHNGGEGAIGKNNYGMLYKLEELEAVNKDYDVQNSWPGYVVIGSNMGGCFWAYNPSKKIYCQIDNTNIDEDTYYTISNSFESFLREMDKELDI